MPSAARPPAWVVACAASFLAYFVLLVYCDIRRPESEGMAIGRGAAGVLVSKVSPGGAADRAGLIDGDQILRANGRRVRTRMDWSVITANFRVDEPTELQVMRGGTTRPVLLVQERTAAGHWRTREGIGVLISRAVQAFTLALGLLIIRRRPRDPVATLGAWALGVFGVFCVVLPYRIADVWRGLPPVAREALWFPFVSSLLAAPVLFSFFLSFPVRRVRSRWVWLALWTPMLAAIAPHVRYHLVSVYQPGAELPADGFLSLIIASAIYLLAAVAVVVWSYRTLSDETERRRLRILVPGTIAACVAGVGAVTGYWRGTSQLDLFGSPAIAVASLLMLLVPVLFAYTILRHRLFDLTFIVRQGVRYALARRLLLSLVPVLLVVLAADISLHRDEPIGQLVAGRASMYGLLVSGLLIAQWRRQQWLEALDRRFFRERYDAQRILRQVAGDIDRSSSLEQAAARVAAQVHLALHPTFVSVLLRRAGEDEYRRLVCVPPGEGPSALPGGGRLLGLAAVLGRPLDVSDVAEAGGVEPLPPEEAALVAASRLELLVPVATSPGATAAVLALGPRRSEEPYASEDLVLLEAIGRGLGFLLDRHTKTAASGTRFCECPRCGTCYDHGSAFCPAEGTALVATRLPRVLAGRYRMECRLGRGGMGVVYRAHDEALDREVAVKVLREELCGDRSAAERFQREARLSARFSHPHVVTIYDFGVVPDAAAFLVMELLRGRTLRQECEVSGKLEPSRVVEVLGPVCEAVGAAHRRQLVHRDLKPENVILADVDGVEIPKVLDFGIAKLTGIAEVNRHGETAVGLLIGTPHYMAPEQLRGEEARPAWDVWALGVIAYELLTGEYPVPASLAGDWGGRLPAGDSSRFAGAAHALGERQQRFFRRALAIDPAARPDTAERFRAEMEDALAAATVLP